MYLSLLTVYKKDKNNNPKKNFTFGLNSRTKSTEQSTLTVTLVLK